MWALPHLTVQLDTIINWRKERQTKYPDPVELGLNSLSAGADAVAITYQENDRQQIIRDFTFLRHLSRGQVFMALPPTQEALRSAFEVKPSAAIIIGEGAGGCVKSFDVLRLKDQLRSFLQSLKDADIPAAVLIEPDLEQAKALHRLDVGVAVLSSRKLCEATNEKELSQELLYFIDVVKSCHRLGLDIAVSGNLTPRELRLLAPVEDIQNIIIGHWLWARSLQNGLPAALAEVKECLTEGPRR